MIKHKRKGIQFLLVGCDGVYETKSNEKLIEFIEERMELLPLETILKQLFDEMVAKNREAVCGTDNMSAILVNFSKVTK